MLLLRLLAHLERLFHAKWNWTPNYLLVSVAISNQKVQCERGLCYGTWRLQFTQTESHYFCLLHVIYSTPELYFWVTSYVLEISDGASWPEFHKMFKITDLVQFNFPVSISPLYVLVCKVCWPCTLCPDLETWRVEGWKSQHVHIVRLQIYEPPQLQRSAKYLRLLVYIVLFLLWWNDMREGKAACKGVSLGDILGNTLRSNYIVCNMLIGHLHSSGTGSPTLDFKVMT